jgi:hypothetical protein
VLGTKTNVGAYAPWWQYRNMAIKALVPVLQTLLEIRHFVLLFFNKYD